MLERSPKAFLLLIAFGCSCSSTLDGGLLPSRAGDDDLGTVSEDAEGEIDAGSWNGSDSGRLSTDVGHPPADMAAVDDVEAIDFGGDVAVKIDATMEGDPCADQDTPPPQPGARTALNDDPAFLQVYVNNIENLKTSGERCRGDWTDLLYYMRTVKPAPDLFLVQQIANRDQLDLLVRRMDEHLPGQYAGVIAESDPKDQASPCGPEKAQQTNAIVYRKGRFDRVGSKHVWQSWANRNDACVRNFQARSKSVMMKFRDKIADKHVTVVSLHWATAQGSGPDPACALKNILETDDKIHRAGFEADLVIAGGDTNEPDRRTSNGFRPWYSRANGDDGGGLNFRDPVFHQCKTGGGLQRCLDDNWTIGGARRIDFLFAKDGDECRAKSRRAHTVTFNEADAADLQLTGTDNADLSYSDHRAVRAEIYY